MKKEIVRKFFKDFKIDKNEQMKKVDPFLRPYYEKATCKICDKKIKGLSTMGCLSFLTNYIPQLIDDDLAEHIKLHIREMCDDEIYLKL